MDDVVIVSGQTLLFDSINPVIQSFNSLTIEQGGTLLVLQTDVALNIGTLAERQVTGSTEPALILFRSADGQDGADGTQTNPKGGPGLDAGVIGQARISIRNTRISGTPKIEVRAQPGRGGTAAQALPEVRPAFPIPAFPPETVAQAGMRPTRPTSSFAWPPPKRISLPRTSIRPRRARAGLPGGRMPAPVPMERCSDSRERSRFRGSEKAPRAVSHAPPFGGRPAHNKLPLT